MAKPNRVHGDRLGMQSIGYWDESPMIKEHNLKVIWGINPCFKFIFIVICVFLLKCQEYKNKF